MSIKIILFIFCLNNIVADLIPHIIHYAWFSENPKTDIVKRCIASWKKYSPDWLIIQWTIETLLPFDNEYIKEAYKVKKYAFVADFLRVFALYKYGGIYMDSDVELKAPLNPFLNHSFFISQTRDKELHVGPHCYGAQKGHPLLKEMLLFYRSHHFIKNGALDQTRVGIRFSMMIKKLYNITLDYKIKNSIELPNNGSIYPTFYFEKQKEGKINFAHHFCTASWIGKNYRDELFLSKCYYSCRDDLKQTNKTRKTKKDLDNKKLKVYIESLYIFIAVLILDLLIQINGLKIKNSFI